jgi:DNA gyrase subunit A
MFFTNTGKVQTLRAFQIPEASRTAKGTNLVNLLQLEKEEKVTALISVEGFSDEEYLVMITREGVIKRTLLSEYAYQRKGGKIAINLDEGDELVSVIHTWGESDLLLATREGNAVRFSEQNVRAMGRTARGVRGITLKGDDYVIGAVLVNDEQSLVTITERGYGKRTPFDNFRVMKNRGGSGVVCQNVTEKTGKLAGILAVSEDDDLMLITDQGVIIRTPAADVSLLSRSAAGVIVMRLDSDRRIVNFTKVAREDEAEGETPDASDEIADESAAAVEALGAATEETVEE